MKSVNQYRLTPGFGGFVSVPHVTIVAAFHAADAAYVGGCV
ncbi:hypothetical protein [Escherichia coli]|nr:hypothetical protein [Escherichia coli]